VTLANRIRWCVCSRAGIRGTDRELYAEQPWIRYAALGVYAVAAASDALDGFSRARTTKDKLGALWIPLSDKLMINIVSVHGRERPNPPPASPTVSVWSRARRDDR